ncbi:MAG: Mth938-like domain-containing protein [Halocynthiibacter sp.]
MEFKEVEFKDAVPVDGYGPGFFRIAGDVFEGALILTAQGVKPWGGLEDAEALVALKNDVDFLLIGMGDAIAPIPDLLEQALVGAGLGGEPMATDAACRTFNVLASEGRRVGVALIPMGGAK